MVRVPHHCTLTTTVVEHNQLKPIFLAQLKQIPIPPAQLPI